MSSVASPASVITDLPPIVQVDPADQVGVALRPLEAGEVLTVEGTPLPVLDPIATGHKIALAPIAAGDDVRRYGWPIGRATQAIPAGAHVHSHNVATKLVGQEPYRYEPAPVNPPLQGEGNHPQGGGGVSPVVMSSNLTSGDTPPSGLRPAISLSRGGTDARHGFRGFVRADGSVGTRNQIWVIPTVGCVGRTAQRVAMAAAKSAGVEDVLAFAHPFGCSQLGDDLDGTARVLAALACHPNAGGVLLLGLGCEENQLSALLERLPPDRRDRVRSVGAQLSADEYGDAARAIAELGEIAGADRRTAVGLEALRLGLKCGGSDGFSGLTANPLIGRAADAVTAAGGTAILTEIPEMFGAERLLMARAQDRATFDRLVTLVDGFKQYFLDHGEPISENPSPGNVEGGITTLEEKSLGAVQKGGRATVTDVLGYGERVRRPGLVVLEAPGNDAVSTTALAAAGATLTLFSTGRGTPLGSPVPTMKLATNHGLAARKPGWIDFDAGAVLDDGLDATAEALLTRICAVASGEPARNEINEEREIALWKRGVTL